MALASAALLAGAHGALARHYSASASYGLLYAQAQTMSAAITLASVWRRLQGRNEWKGRSYSTEGPAPTSGVRYEPISAVR